MSYANSKNVGANHYRKGLKNFTNYLNRWGKGNKSIQGLIHGNVIDAMSTQLKMGQSLVYNQSMASHYAKINQGLENLKTGNQLKLMGAEGRIAGQLIGTQGEEQRGRKRRKLEAAAAPPPTATCTCTCTCCM